MNPFIGLVDSGRVADEAALKRAFRLLAKRVHPDLAGSHAPAPAGADPAESAPTAAGSAASGGAAHQGAAHQGAAHQGAAHQGAAHQGAAPADPLRASRAFVALRAEYEEARAYLAARAAGRAGGADSGGCAGGGGGGGGAGNGRAGADRSSAADKGPAPRAARWDRRAFYESLEDLLGRGFPRRPGAAWPGRAYDASREKVLAYLAGRDQVYPEDSSREAFLAFEAGYAALARGGGGWLSVDNDAGRSVYFLLADVLSYHELGFAHVRRIARSIHPDAERLARARGELRPLAFLSLLVADLEKGPAIAD